MKMLNRLKKLFNFQPSSSLEQVRDFISVADVLEDNRREKEIVNLQVWIDKPLIVISNSDPYISVGMGKGITFITQANDPVLVFDCFSDSPEEIVQKICMSSVVMFYDEFKLDALLKLNPWEVAHLFYGKHSYRTEKNDKHFSFDQMHIRKKEDYLLWNGFDQAVEAHYVKG